MIMYTVCKIGVVLVSPLQFSHGTWVQQVETLNWWSLLKTIILVTTCVSG
jgi:hypothetical protein